MSTDKRLITLREAEYLYSRSYSEIYQAVRSGALESLRPKRSYLVEPDAVMAWIRAESESRADADDS